MRSSGTAGRCLLPIVPIAWTSLPELVLQQRPELVYVLPCTQSGTTQACRARSAHYGHDTSSLLCKALVILKTTETQHLDRLGQLGELKQESNTAPEWENNTASLS